MSILRLPSATLTAIGLIPLLLVGFAARLASLPAPVATVLSTLAGLWAVAFVLMGWVRLDETAKEAHKFAWFWGSIAMVAVLLACMIPGVPAFARQHVEGFIAQYPGTPWQPGSLGFVMGVMTAVLAQLAGWAVVWSLWWIARRR